MSTDTPTRRDFLTVGIRRALQGATNAAANAAGITEERPDPVAPAEPLRPPGALPAAEFLTACTRCGECVPVCPPNALSLLPADAGPTAGTPVVTPTRQPCLMCTETPCITACEPRALVREGSIPAIGRAEVDTSRCWSAQGQDCDYCARDCRRHVAAITLERGQVPVVNAKRCDGCGLCEYICPVPGGAAIRVIPIDVLR